jgi:hypothetical protein
MYRCQFGMKSDRAADALKEHELVADAIAERDGELAEWLMRRHIRASRRAIERRLAGQALSCKHKTWRGTAPGALVETMQMELLTRRIRCNDISK